MGISPPCHRRIGHQRAKVKRKELIELFYAVEEAANERHKLGEFDTNSKYMILLLDGMQKLVQHAIERSPEEPAPKKRGKK